jgi:hypothetical protein
MDETHDPMDIAMIAADDQLFETLRSGGVPEDGDEVAILLAAWRADLADDLPTVRSAAVPAAVTGAAVRPRRRSARALLAAAAAVLALAGAATVVAADARPGSPLWPLTRVLYADRASSAVAEQDAQRAIDQARDAIADRRYSDADELLDEATSRANQVHDAGVLQRLLEQVAALRGLLPGAVAAPSTSPSAGQAGGGGSTGTGTDPSPASSPGGILPTAILPTGVLPSSILPPLPLPTTLPGLPLPAGLP